MSELPAIILEERAVLDRIIPALRTLQQTDHDQERELLQSARAMHAAWTEARGDTAQREAFEEALGEAKRALDAHRNARHSRQIPLGTPYFARMVLSEGARRQEVLLGKVGVVERGVRICDWRDAPISQIYYNYEEGEEYCEQIGDREREGVLAIRRRVDIREGVIVEVQGATDIQRLRPDGFYASPGRARPEAGEDHRLPDIVSLITREQFQVITRAEAGVVLLRGRAGSGKTTVALHRIAFLHFRDPQRFHPAKMMVVMFNKALQTYISRVLPDLGIAGVPVETFHGWAGRLLRAGGIDMPFGSQTSPGISRLKRHPAINALLRAYVQQLGAKTAEWLGGQLDAGTKKIWDRLQTTGLFRVGELREKAGGGAWWGRLEGRLLDHTRDLWTMFQDEALLKAHLPKPLHTVLPALRRHSLEASQRRCLDWEDAALILRLGQLKHREDRGLACAWAGRYAHIVIDEAQDLSTVELEALVDAADAARSVTIAGDPAQKILADAQFEGFEQLLTRLTGNVQVRMDALAVGHRSTRPIMELALRALETGDASTAKADPAVIAARDGEPVVWCEGAEEEVFAAVLADVLRFREQRPSSLVAVLARTKPAADQWARRLKEAKVAGVRRADRADFSFHPGVVVSNVHQVKGLEFDGVVVVEPADFGANDRHLLHVAITRAADRLWMAAAKGRGGLRGPGDQGR